MGKLANILNNLSETQEDRDKKQAAIVAKAIDDHEKKQKLDKEKADAAAKRKQEAEETALLELEERRHQAAKDEMQKSKDEATAAGDPWVTMRELNLDPENPQKVQSIELDWNKPFIDKLKSVGLSGTEGEIVDQWFSDICKDMALDVYDPDVFAEREGSEKTNLGNGKTEYR